MAVLPDGTPDAALAAVLPGDVNRVEATVDPAWLGRRLAGASVGVAFGAGGAKGWAHVGALRSLQRAGYVLDAAADSSIGAWIGAWTALGHEADTVEQLLRDRFDADAVQAMFRRGGAGGTAVMARLARETTADAGFADLVMPLAVLAADLAAQRPVSLSGMPAGSLTRARKPWNRHYPGCAPWPAPGHSAREAAAAIPA